MNTGVEGDDLLLKGEGENAAGGISMAPAPANKRTH